MTGPKRNHYYKSYRSTFFIFPAMIPLIEILPWLLGLIGGAAGVAEFLRQKKSARIGFILAGVCFLSAIGVYGFHHYNLPSKKEGSVLLGAGDMSQNVPASSPSVPINGLQNMTEFGLIWHQRSDREITGTPTIGDQVIVTGSYNHTVEGRNLFDGHKIWELNKSEPIYTAPVIYNGIAIIGEGAHTAPSANLTAISLADGKPIWERKFLSHIESPGIVDPNTNYLYQSVGAQGIWAIDALSGVVKWREEIGHMDSSPLLMKGSLYAVGKLLEYKDGSALFRLDPATGKVLSQTALPGNPMGAVMAAGEDKIIFSTAIGQIGLNKDADKGWIHAVTPEGKILWTTELSSMPLPDGNIINDAGLAYFVLKDSTMVALDIKDGSIKWQKKSGGEYRTDAVLMPNQSRILIASITSDGYVSILNPLNGDNVKSFKVQDGGYASLTYKDDVLYIPEVFGLSAYGPVSAIK